MKARLRDFDVLSVIKFILGFTEIVVACVAGGLVCVSS